LQALLTALSGPQGSRNLQGGGHGIQPQRDLIETGLVQALRALQARPDFREILSTTNEYSQTLAHLAVLYDYPPLLRHLVDWCIDLAISDVHGLTALHCAYIKGDLHSVHILRRGGAPEAVKDKLGRIPSDLRPERVGRGIDAEMYPLGNDIEEQVALRGQCSALDLDEDNDSGHGQSDSGDNASNTKDPAGIVVESFADGGEGGSEGRSGQIAAGGKEPVIKRGPRILPSTPFDTSISNLFKNYRGAASKPANILTRGIPPTSNSDDGIERIAEAFK
jgi:hypothetical protein